MVFAIGRVLRTVSGERAAGAALGLTVFCMVLGSSSVPELVGPGRKLRWVALLVLAAIGVVLAAKDRRQIGRVPLGVLGTGAWLAAIALVSTVWSVDPLLTFGRAGSLALLFVTAGAFAIAARVRPELPAWLLYGFLGGAVAASLGGLVLIAADHAAAIQAATDAQPPRLQGLGENPDTIAMLDGIALPVALWTVERARSNAWRAVGLASSLLLVGSISASGSRGGLFAAVVGGLGYALLTRVPIRRRVVLTLVVAGALAGAGFATRIPQPLPSSVAPAPTKPAANGKGTVPLQVGQRVGPTEQQYGGRLQDELFRVYTGSRSFITSSGRLQAWYTAIQQGDSRPLLGFGFGTEDKVFIDRVYNFQGAYVEDSFVGLYLQLGLVGVVTILALLVSMCVAVVRAVRRSTAGSPAPALAGVVAGGLVLMLVQSYAYSVGNVATVAFWMCGFIATAVAVAPRRQPAVVAAPGAEEEAVARA